MRRKIVWTGVWLALAASPGHAQSLRLPTVVLAGAAATDLLSTFSGGSNRENNPAISWMQPAVSFRTTVLIGGISEVAAVVIATKLLKRRPKVARTLMFMAAGAHAVAAGDNWRRQR